MELESITYKGHEIVIEHDESPQNPRTEWDNFTEIHCSSSRNYLGEHNHKTWDDLHAAVRKAERRGDIAFKMFAYIHSGTALSLETFHGRLPQGHAEFDSGHAGYVIVKKKDIIGSWGKKNWTEKLRQKAYEVAKSDLETFDAYLNGEVYGFVIDDHGDSCWGYYSVEEAMEEAKHSVDYTVKHNIKEHLKQLKLWIKNKVPLRIRLSLKTALATQF